MQTYKSWRLWNRGSTDDYLKRNKRGDPHFSKPLHAQLSAPYRRPQAAKPRYVKPYAVKTRHPMQITTPVPHTPYPLEPVPSSLERRKAAASRLQTAMDEALAPSTMRNYNSSIGRFLAFTADLGYSKAQSLPCSGDLLCMFLCEGLGRYGSSAAKSYISAIRSWHVRNGFDWNPPLRISLIKKALDRLKAASPIQKQPRLPITPRMIKILAESWSQGSNKQKCALACALSAWFGQMRLGEILPASANSCDRSRLPKCSNFQIRTNISDTSSTIALPWSKTQGWKGDTIHLTAQKHGVSPTLAIQAHISSSILPNSALICEYRSGSHIRTLDKQEFMTMCNTIWSNNGFSKYTGHSFRIGGTTMLLRCGVEPEVVKKMGRWHSDAFQLYWRDLDDIFDGHAANLPMEDW